MILRQIFPLHLFLVPRSLSRIVSDPLVKALRCTTATWAAGVMVAADVPVAALDVLTIAALDCAPCLLRVESTGCGWCAATAVVGPRARDCAGSIVDASLALTGAGRAENFRGA